MTETGLQTDSLSRQGEITISDSSPVDASGERGGQVFIRGGRLMIDDSGIFADTQGELDSTGTGIDILVTGNIAVTNGSFITTDVFGAGDARDVRIEGNSITVIASSVRSSTSDDSSGDAGNLMIRANRVEVREGATIGSPTFGQGQAGDVMVDADTVLVSDDGAQMGATGITTLAGQGATGDAGNLSLKANRLEMRGGFIGASTLGAGQGGNVTVEAGTVLMFSGVMSAATVGQGQGGNVRVEAGTVLISGGSSLIIGSTFGQGQGGNIIVKADRVLISGDGARGLFTGIFSNSERPTAGNAGSVRVEAGSLAVRNGGAISTSTVGTGNAGTLTILANDVNLTDGSAIGSLSIGPGIAGDTTIRAVNFRSQNAGVTAEAEQSSGGNITIIVGEVIDLVDSKVTTSVGGGDGTGGNIIIDSHVLRLRNSQIEANAAALGGNVEITGDSVQLTEGSLIEALVSDDPASPGRGGNTTLNSNSLLILDDSQARATAQVGPGGVITVNSEVFLHDGARLEPDVLDASSGTAGSNDGTVTVNSPEQDISGSITKLPTNFQQTTALLHEPCATRTDVGRSRFVVTGRGGLPSSPEDHLPATTETDSEYRGRATSSTEIGVRKPDRLGADTRLALWSCGKTEL